MLLSIHHLQLAAESRTGVCRRCHTQVIPHAFGIVTSSPRFPSELPHKGSNPGSRMAGQTTLQETSRAAASGPRAQLAPPCQMLHIWVPRKNLSWWMEWNRFEDEGEADFCRLDEQGTYNRNSFPRNETLNLLVFTGFTICFPCWDAQDKPWWEYKLQSQVGLWS